MNDNKYNGWSNYATWRVNLEILSDMDWYETEYVDADYLKSLVEDVVFSQHEESLMSDYANAFLSEVNYHEIAEHILEEKEIEKQIENE